jgi:nucleotide-binding universal stress UspA family protein
MTRARAAELRAFHVVATTAETIPERLGVLERDRHMAELREALASVDSTNDRTGAAVRQGDPGAQILQFARLLPADLIVMGAAGGERPGRPMGSVTATVVARSQCPVLIVPAGRKINPEAPGLFRRIVCAVDLAPASVSVIRHAVSLARETGALVTCACIMMDPEPSSSEIHDRLLKAIPPEARGWCDIEVMVKRGAPAAEIIRVAETSDADVLLIGPPRRWTSTTQAVLARSVCPVLVTHDVRPLPYPINKGNRNQTVPMIASTH